MVINNPLTVAVVAFFTAIFFVSLGVVLVRLANPPTSEGVF
jgi:hypothetical protein